MGGNREFIQLIKLIPKYINWKTKWNVGVLLGQIVDDIVS